MNNTDQKKTKMRVKVPHRSSCPLCGHKELLTEGMDQFCLSCDWDTCAEHVARGWMDNLEVACFAHFPALAKLTESEKLTLSTVTPTLYLKKSA